MLVGRCSSELSGHRLQGKLKSHSLRAQPRDLQFRRLVLEMFFDRVRMRVEVKGVPRLRRSDNVGESMPSDAGLG